MDDNNGGQPQFHWLDNVNINMNDLQQRLVQENNLQRHVGQVSLLTLSFMNIHAKLHPL